MRSLFSKTHSTQQSPVTLYFWRIRMGTERAGHVAIQIGDAYYSFWAENSPAARERGEAAKMFLIRDLARDKMIVGYRIKHYREKVRPETLNSNDIDLPSAPEILAPFNTSAAAEEKPLAPHAEAKGLSAELPVDIQKMGTPDDIITLHSLNSRAMQSYLEQVVRKKDNYHWSSLGKAKQGFNCSTFIHTALKKGNLAELTPSHATLYRKIGFAAAILLSIIQRHTLATIATRAVLGLLIGGAVGGLYDSQPILEAGMKVISANRSGLSTHISKLAIWFFGSLASTLASTAGIDRVLDQLFTSPDRLYDLATQARARESAITTLAAPRPLALS